MSVAVPSDQITAKIKSEGLQFYRISAVMTSPPDTIMGPFVTTGRNQMPSALADQLFGGTTFLPDYASRRHMDLAKGAKRPILFAIIRSFHSTAG